MTRTDPDDQEGRHDPTAVAQPAREPGGHAIAASKNRVLGHAASSRTKKLRPVRSAEQGGVHCSPDSGVEEALPLFFHRLGIGRRGGADIGLRELARDLLVGRLQRVDLVGAPAALGRILDAEIHVRAGIAAVARLQGAIFAAEEVVQHLVDVVEIAAVLGLGGDIGAVTPLEVAFVRIGIATVPGAELEVGFAGRRLPAIDDDRLPCW